LVKLKIEDGQLITKTISSCAVPTSDALVQYITYFDELQNIHHTLLRNKKGVMKPKGMALVSELERYILRVLPCDSRKENFPTMENILQNLHKLETTPFILTQDELWKAYDDERAEISDVESVLLPQVKQVVALLKIAKHVVFYTGAGISTSASIPDFRGPTGVWTLQEKGEYASKTKGISEARPTYSHYAITELVRRHLVHFVISTNMDSLHIRSGLPKHLIIEQHGNSNKEICESCGLQYWRAYDVGKSVVNYRDHYTFRYCTWCNGKLKDTIVHFSEDFSEEHVEVLSLYHARKCDLAIVMGTSMNVQPNATYPDQCLKNPNGKMVIVNLQKTPFDNVASVRVFCKTDIFMKMVMDELKIMKFDMEMDCKEQWDRITKEEMEKCSMAAWEHLEEERFAKFVGSGKLH